MTDAEFRKAVSEALCDEYIESIPEHRSDHVFSEGFHAKMDKLVKRRKKPYYRLVNTTFKRWAVTAAAVLLLCLAPLSVKAVRKEAYDFIIRIFPDHSELSVDKTDNSYPKKIMEEYYIPGLEDWETHIWENNSQVIARDFTNGDNFIVFYQCTIDHYVVEFEKDKFGMEEYVDEYGVGYLIEESEGGVSLIWNNGEYVFLLSCKLDKEDTLELCRTIKIKENSELLSQSE